MEQVVVLENYQCGLTDSSGRTGSLLLVGLKTEFPEVLDFHDVCQFAFVINVIYCPAMHIERIDARRGSECGCPRNKHNACWERSARHHQNDLEGVPGVLGVLGIAGQMHRRRVFYRDEFGWFSYGFGTSRFPKIERNTGRKARIGDGF